MSVLSAQTIRKLKLIEPMRERYVDVNGNSAGLSCASYDLALAQNVYLQAGGFELASTEEKFNMPAYVIGIVHDKSSLARQGIVVQNTVAEPGWRGYLTLELTLHGDDRTLIKFLKKGQAIAQVVFHFLDEPTDHPYAGKYQNQEFGPQGPRRE